MASDATRVFPLLSDECENKSAKVPNFWSSSVLCAVAFSKCKPNNKTWLFQEMGEASGWTGVEGFVRGKTPTATFALQHVFQNAKVSIYGTWHVYFAANSPFNRFFVFKWRIHSFFVPFWILDTGSLQKFRRHSFHFFATLSRSDESEKCYWMADFFKDTRSQHQLFEYKCPLRLSSHFIRLCFLPGNCSAPLENPNKFPSLLRLTNERVCWQSETFCVVCSLFPLANAQRGRCAEWKCLVARGPAVVKCTALADLDARSLAPHILAFTFYPSCCLFSLSLLLIFFRLLWQKNLKPILLRRRLTPTSRRTPLHILKR